MIQYSNSDKNGNTGMVLNMNYLHPSIENIVSNDIILIVK